MSMTTLLAATHRKNQSVGKFSGLLNANNLIPNQRNIDLTATEQLTFKSTQVQNVSAVAAQNLILPDATTLINETIYLIDNRNYGAGTEAVTIQTHHATTPVDLQEILRNEIYMFQLVSNGSAAGTWRVIKLAGDSVNKFIKAFLVADWGSADADGIFTLSIPASEHGKGIEPVTYTIYEISGSTRSEFGLQEFSADTTTGDITMKILPEGGTAIDGVVVIV
jgi:hypothetical protein